MGDFECRFAAGFCCTQGAQRSKARKVLLHAETQRHRGI